MNRKRKAKTHRAKSEVLFDRRGFVTTVAGTVVGGVILDGLHTIYKTSEVADDDALSLDFSDPRNSMYIPVLF